MTYIVADPCVKCKYTDCVAVCPVECFFEGKNTLVIQPDECIDCGACEPECPSEAIFEESALPEKWAVYQEINAVFSGATEPGDANTAGWPEHLKEALITEDKDPDADDKEAVGSGFQTWPLITEDKDPLPDADDYQDTENKLGDFDPTPFSE